jgi:hypothetical protein
MIGKDLFVFFVILFVIYHADSLVVFSYDSAHDMIQQDAAVIFSYYVRKVVGKILRTSPDIISAGKKTCLRNCEKKEGKRIRVVVIVFDIRKKRHLQIFILDDRIKEFPDGHLVVE